MRQSGVCRECADPQLFDIMEQGMRVGNISGHSSAGGGGGERDKDGTGREEGQGRSCLPATGRHTPSSAPHTLLCL